MTRDERRKIAEQVVARLRKRGAYGTISMDTVYEAIDATLDRLGVAVEPTE